MSLQVGVAETAQCSLQHTPKRLISRGLAKVDTQNAAPEKEMP